MTTQEQIDFVTEQIRKLGKRLRFLRAHKALMETLPASGPCYEGLDFDNLSHADVIKVIRGFGGKWKKEACGDNRINYEAQIQGVRVRCWQGEPPPNCKVIEYEEIIPERVVPAQVVKKRKLVCQPNLAAVIATAAEKGQTNEHSAIPDETETEYSATKAETEQAGVTPGSADPSG